MKIKDYLNKTKLLDNGFEISDNQNHKIKLKVTKDNPLYVGQGDII